MNKKLTHIHTGAESSAADIILVPGQNLYTGASVFNDYFGGIDSMEEDILNVAAGIYGADLCVPRMEREQHIRNIEISIEVVNKSSWESIKNKLIHALIILSKDNWKINFIAKQGIPINNYGWNSSEGAVLLFSGGIDSMCAASEFLKEGRPVTLVSHNTQGNGVVDACQKNVHKSLEEFYDAKLEHLHMKVFGRNKSPYKFPEERENSQRTRSFLFLSLAVVVMKRKKFSRILFMAENGQFAIHLPLNQARVGPFSTHTADPEFLQVAKDIFAGLLDNKMFSIENPFLYKTKAEVFALLPPALMKAAIRSGSCWKISRTIKHCGDCVPCISRRISIEYNGLQFDEYVKDLFNSDVGNLDETNTGKRNLVDYLEFISRFKTLTPATKNDLVFEFPELFNKAIDQDAALQLYHRMALQSYAVLDKYPFIKKLL